MKKKLLAFLCLLTVLAGVLAFAVPQAVSAAGSNTYLVGYAKTNIDPIDAAGTYRTIDLTSRISDATKSGKYSAFSYLTLAEGDVYTVADYSAEVGVSGAVPQGYFRVPLGGYAGQEDRMSQGRMDDSGNGTVGDEDGMWATCVLISDGTNIIALVGIDAISADSDVVTSVKTKVHNAIPEIPRANIFITASHSHSGVYTSVFGTTYDTEEEAKDAAAVEKAAKAAAQLAYKSLMADRIAQAVIDAYNSKAQATIEKASLSIVDENNKANMNFVRHYNVTKKSNWGSSTTKYVSGDNFGGSQTSSNFVDGLMYTYTIEPVSVADNTMNMLRITYTDGSQDPILYANWRAHPKINSTASSEYGQANRPYYFVTS